jgi:hypothetical protein
MYGASNLIPKKTSINVMQWLGTITVNNFEMLVVVYHGIESATKIMINHIKPWINILINSRFLVFHLSNNFDQECKFDLMKLLF